MFIDEQRVPENLEWDDDRRGSVHALAEDADGVADRLRPPAARRPHRPHGGAARRGAGRGVGDALLRVLIDGGARARRSRAILLNAQVQAMPFYARHGFAPQARAFDEAGIAAPGDDAQLAAFARRRASSAPTGVATAKR